MTDLSKNILLFLVMRPLDDSSNPISVYFGSNIYRNKNNVDEIYSGYLTTTFQCFEVSKPLPVSLEMVS